MTRSRIQKQPSEDEQSNVASTNSLKKRKDAPKPTTRKGAASSKDDSAAPPTKRGRKAASNSARQADLPATLATRKASTATSKPATKAVAQQASATAGADAGPATQVQRTTRRSSKPLAATDSSLPHRSSLRERKNPIRYKDAPSVYSKEGRHLVQAGTYPFGRRQASLPHQAPPQKQQQVMRAHSTSVVDKRAEPVDLSRAKEHMRRIHIHSDASLDAAANGRSQHAVLGSPQSQPLVLPANPDHWADVHPFAAARDANAQGVAVPPSSVQAAVAHDANDVQTEAATEAAAMEAAAMAAAATEAAAREPHKSTTKSNGKLMTKPALPDDNSNSAQKAPGGKGQRYWSDYKRPQIMRMSGPTSIPRPEGYTLCHDCLHRYTLYHPCVKCSKCFCSSCIERHCYQSIADNHLPPKLRDQFNAGVCPACLGMCVCKRCLHRPSPTYKAPTYAPEQRRIMAAHILRVVLPLVTQRLAEETALVRVYALSLIAAHHPSHQAAEAGLSMKDVHPLSPSQARICCDLCATSIPNIHLRCTSANCHVDVCIACCREEEVQLNDPTCLVCGQKARLVRVLPDNVLDALAAAADVLAAYITEHGEPSAVLRPDGSVAADGSVVTDGSGAGWEGMQPEDRRTTANRGDGTDTLLAPCWSVLQSPGGEAALSMQPHVLWTPNTMLRAARTKDSPKLEVVDCATWKDVHVTCVDFFRQYEQQHERMLKLKDYPQTSHFADALQLHNSDFLRMLPLPHLMHPECGPLNLAVHMLRKLAKASDLGPKTYIAYGRREEHEVDGDSVTKLHMDMADAVNILLHVQGGGAGAVWDVWRREDVPKLRAFLLRHIHEFTHAGMRLTKDVVNDVIFDQTFMLSGRHRAMLLEEYGVQAWRFEQHEREAVFIPAGCPHQVRNLRSCIKVAVDFVAPESMAHCLRMIDDMRLVGKANLLDKLGHMPLSDIKAPYERHYNDKLQGRLLLFCAAAQAVWTLQEVNAQHA